MLLGHSDLAEILRWFATRLDLPKPPVLQDRGLPLSLDELRPLLIEAGTWFDAAPPAEKRLLAVVKALLIACDVAGSALPRTGCSVRRWIADTLGRSLATADLEHLVNDALDGHPVRPFQAAVRDSGSLAFVRAGCGSGKTAAAYLWASRHANGRRLIFCYPTTGTATEGFRDYALESELAPNARLLHGRASVDLEDILGAEPEEDAHHAARLQALEAWPSLLVVCTVDRVLGLIQNYRSSLFAFPALAASAFVFDEVHLFDRRLFGALLRFLEDGLPGAPVLLMTASLPASRRQLLEEVARRRGAPLEIINGPRDLEDLPRYELLGTRAEPPWDKIEATLAHGERNKVLWVANTVSRAMDFAVQARERGLDPVLSYHSRFKYEDRVARHADVIRAFRSPGPALAISTQVCEVSLDISADLLVSDLAPVPALIQRLGRLNRRASLGACQPRPALFLETKSTLPYPEAEFDIDRTRAWVNELAGRPVSQTDLANAFSERDQGEDSPSLESEWLDGGIHAFTAPVRETNQGLSVILAADEGVCTGSNGHPDRDQLIRKTLPMGSPPRGHYWPGWRRLGFTPVVPDGLILYSERVGASWQRK
jgi:CRISPR-associated endonuclease/helicase Cas3